MPETFNILIGVTGSVATIKISQLIEAIEAIPTVKEKSIKVISTKNAGYFLSRSDFSNWDSQSVLTDEDEWTWEERGDPVLHIELVKWADLFLISPLDALTLSKIANGHCDNLLTCCAMAWPLDDCKKYFVVCPSMNTKMWQHPATEKNLCTIKSFGIRVIRPISKKLMCGDVGVGAMEEPSKIALKLTKILRVDRCSETILSMTSIVIFIAMMGFTIRHAIRTNLI